MTLIVILRLKAEESHIKRETPHPNLPQSGEGVNALLRTTQRRTISFASQTKSFLFCYRADAHAKLHSGILYVTHRKVSQANVHKVR